MQHPFGIRPTDAEVIRATKKAASYYAELPETTCGHRACCCKAGCPNMYYSEYLNIRDAYVDKMSKDERFELLMGCIWYYLFNQYEDGQPVAKPCLHLSKDNMCQVYSARPLKCRTYGLVPADMHREIVEAVAKENKMDPGEIPLCIQCPFVKVKPEYAEKFPDNRIPEETIRRIEAALSKTDRDIGISKKIQEEGYGFLTFHDWHLMCELGETWMSNLTPLRQKLSKVAKEQFFQDLKKAFKEQK